MSTEINRISPIRQRPSVEIEHKPKNKKSTRPTDWTNHLKICSQLYGMKTTYVKSCPDMRYIYYNSIRDEDGKIMYPKQLNLARPPSDKYLTRVPWTGKAQIDPDGISADISLYNP
uniref:Uncharacterized protein n=1 Tax=viral metagenome TaxID=1070528 RepID=A0A6C0LU63_9ZZZZ